MAEITEQRLGYAFGLLGGALFVLGGIAALVLGTVDLVVGRPGSALGAGAEAIGLFVVGALALLFAWLARHDWSGRPVVGGVLLLVTAVLGWIVIGDGGNLLALIGSLLVALAGVLYLVGPAQRAARSVVHT